MKISVALLLLILVGCKHSTYSIEFAGRIVTCKEGLPHRDGGYDLWDCDDGNQHRVVTNVSVRDLP